MHPIYVSSVCALETVLLGEQFSKVWMYRFNEPTEAGSPVYHSADNYLLFLGTQ